MVDNFGQLFYADPYQSEFTAEIISVKSEKNKLWLALSQTCFYPEGGGQPGDQGILQVIGQDEQIVKVFDTIGSDSEIWHQVDQLLPEGTPIVGQIDFARRYDLMQQHSGEHIFSGIVNREYKYTNVGFNINATEMTFDFDGDLTWTQIAQVEKEANQAIYENIPIEIRYITKSEQDKWTYRSKLELDQNIRLVIIPGYDTCACAGTHLARTGEIGQIKIVKRESYKGGVRLTALCGARALSYFQNILQVMRNAGEIMSANPNNLIEKINNQQSEISNLKFQINKKNKAWLDLFAEKLQPNTKRIILCNPEFEKQEWKYVCRYLIGHASDFVCILRSENQHDHIIFLYSEKFDLKTLIPALKAKFDFRGGGNQKLIQGKLQGQLRIIEGFLNEIT
ncbi:MAG TPA: alanyl-tRNA editing protein [Clostridiaceae bacterium]|nr:alanyl-tRNA editing protein [Clostridiaceae bacterium]